MKKMLKRADGSYSQRGLWDNIRANKGSGKEPTKEMLKQEKKIKSKGMGGPGDQGKPTAAASDTTSTPKTIKSSGTSTNAAGEKINWSNTYDTRTGNSTTTDKYGTRVTDKSGMQYSLPSMKTPIKPTRKKSGGKKSNWLEESKELKFGGVSKKKYLEGGPEPSPAPAMSFEQAFKEYSSGRMTAAQANAASGYGNKQKKYTDAENIDNLKKVFVGSHTVDAQGNITAKPKAPMADISTAGLRPSAPAESTSMYTKRLKSGGKKKMGGKNC